MASARISESVKRIFTETFTARDVAEPLASFDAVSSAALVRDFMQARDFEVVGVRREGQLAGFVEVSSLADGLCGDHLRPFDDAIVLDEATPLLDVLFKLNQSSRAFVTMLGNVGGIITRGDLQKPPVRMWLFGFVTLVEIRFAELIERHCPGDTWKSYVSEARLQKAQALLEERSRRNQTLQVFDCLQFSDKGQIVARHEEIRRRTVFASRSQAEATVKKLEQLRNHLAHAQDIVTTDWDTIMQLCEFFQTSMNDPLGPVNEFRGGGNKTRRVTQ
jgi:hypothetical protein